MTRKCTDEMRNALKTAFKRVVVDLGGGVAAASCTRVGNSQISDYSNIYSDKMPPVDVVLDLEMISGQPHITIALAAMQGRALVVVEPLRAKNDLAVLLARIGQDSGVLFGDAAAALAHKAVTPKQRATLSEDLRELIDAAREALAWLSEAAQ